MASNTPSDSQTAFRLAEKKYKANVGQPKKGEKQKKKKNANNIKTDYPSVLPTKEIFDFHNLENNTPENAARIVQMPTHQVSADRRYLSNHIPFYYAIKDKPGFYVIPGAFSSKEQRYWIKRCAIDFALNSDTNVSNLNNDKVWTKKEEIDLNKLRWSVLGYRFLWTIREYEKTNTRELPDDLVSMMKHLAALVGFDSMQPQAATLNYYPKPKDSMCGHVDDSEEEMSQPIVSCSFGNTIIFLMGGRSRDEEPIAVYVRSGDTVVMSGEARFGYHGVPRVLEKTSPEFLWNFQEIQKEETKEKEEEEEEYIKWCAEYMRDARVNVNTRQVKKTTKNENI